MNIGQRIKLIREEKGLSQGTLAKLSGISQSAISYIEREDRITSVDTVGLIAKALSCDPADLINDGSAHLLFEGGIPISTRTLPLLNTAAVDMPPKVTFTAYTIAGAEVPATMAIRATDDSMEGARIKAGDILFVHQQSTIANGEVAAVTVDGKLHIRRVYHLPGNVIMLQADNHSIPPLIIGTQAACPVVRIIGKIVATQVDIE